MRIVVYLFFVCSAIIPLEGCAMQLKPFYYMRHGETEWNAEGKLCGQQDIPLNEVGMQQAESAVSIINTLPVSNVFYSPLQRAAQTADIACRDLICSKISLDDLKECFWGSLEGTREPRATARMQEPGYDGESTESYRARIIKGINHALSHEGIPLIVAHGGMYHMLVSLLNIDGKSIKNCEVLLFTPPSAGHQRWVITTVTIDSVTL